MAKKKPRGSRKSASEQNESQTESPAASAAPPADQPAGAPSRHRAVAHGYVELLRDEPGEAHALFRDLLIRYAPACVVINREFEVLYVSGPTHEYLVQPMGAPSHDLLAMAREGLADKLRPMVRRAVEENQPAVATAEVRRGGKFFPVRCMAVPLKAPREADGLLLVSFEDQPPRSSAAPPDPEGDQQPQIEQLEYELAVTRDDVQAAVERLESSNEEYKAANEEVRSMNEELQSINEELETSKDELQSLNEELTSVNHQLEGKVLELEAVTDDLSNLLRSTDIATLFLDRQFRIRRFTPAVRRLMNLIPGDLGRPLSDIARNFSDEKLLQDAEAVLEKLVPREAEVSTPDVSWYIRRILPYRTEDDRIDGVVITFTDITARKRAAQELSELARSLERKIEQRTRCVRLLQDVAVIANEARSVPEAIQATLDRVCCTVGWSAGHAFLLDEDDGDMLVDTGLWRLPASGGLARLVEATREARFARGEGIAGRVLETARPVLVRDVAHDPAFMRAAALDADIHAVYAFPILSGARVVGVLEFFVANEADPDPELVEGLREIGTQLGRVIERTELQREVAEATAHEQRFVGQELHDTIAQDIAGIGMLVGRLEQDLRGAGSPLAGEAATLAVHIESIRQHVRQLAHGLMPVEVESGRLPSALDTLAAMYRDLHGIDCAFRCEGDCTVESSTVAMHLHRIAQEALQNALRHAHPERIEITLARQDNCATLTVQDDGRGYDPATQPPGGLGLQIMRYRANLVGAQLEIRSRPGEGTQVVCTFGCHSA